MPYSMPTYSNCCIHFMHFVMCHTYFFFALFAPCCVLISVCKILMHAKLPPCPFMQTLSPVSLPTLTQSVVRCVCLLCERMCFMEPPDMIDAVFNLRRSCKTATELELEESLFSPTVSQLCTWLNFGPMYTHVHVIIVIIQIRLAIIVN